MQPVVRNIVMSRMGVRGVTHRNFIVFGLHLPVKSLHTHHDAQALVDDTSSGPLSS